VGDPSGGSFNPIGAVSLQVLPWLHWTTEWNARSLNSGLSLSLFNSESFNITLSPLFEEFLGISTDYNNSAPGSIKQSNRFSFFGQINLKFK
jgi:hypothetical protein